MRADEENPLQKSFSYILVKSRTIPILYMCNAPWARKFYFNIIFIRDLIKIKMPADRIIFVMVIDPEDII